MRFLLCALFVLVLFLGLFFIELSVGRHDVLLGQLNEYLYSDFHPLVKLGEVEMLDDYQVVRSEDLILNGDEIDVDFDGVADFRVINQVHDGSGLDSYLLEQEGALVISIRGTEASEVADILTDITLGVGVSEPEQYGVLVDLVIGVVESPAKYGVTDEFDLEDVSSITGHSLGGGLSIGLGLELFEMYGVEPRVVSFNASPFYYAVDPNFLVGEVFGNVKLYVASDDPLYDLNKKVLFSRVYNPYDYFNEIMLVSGGGHSQGIMLGYLSERLGLDNKWKDIFND